MDNQELVVMEEQTVVDDELLSRFNILEIDPNNAMNFLIERYHKIAYGIAHQMGIRAPDAEDVVSEIFIKLWEDNWKGLKNWNPHKPFEPWFRAVVVNACIDWFRKNRRYNELERLDQSLTQGEGSTTLGDTVADSRQSPDDGAIEDEMIRVVREVIDPLPLEQRVVVYLYYYVGLKGREISELLGQNDPNWAHNVLHDARRTMREELRQRGIHEFSDLYYEDGL